MNMSDKKSVQNVLLIANLYVVLIIYGYDYFFLDYRLTTSHEKIATKTTDNLPPHLNLLP